MKAVIGIPPNNDIIEPYMLLEYILYNSYLFYKCHDIWFLFNSYCSSISFICLISMMSVQIFMEKMHCCPKSVHILRASVCLTYQIWTINSFGFKSLSILFLLSVDLEI